MRRKVGRIAAGPQALGFCSESEPDMLHKRLGQPGSSYSYELSLPGPAVPRGNTQGVSAVGGQKG